MFGYRFKAALGFDMDDEIPSQLPAFQNTEQTRFCLLHHSRIVALCLG